MSEVKKNLYDEIVGTTPNRAVTASMEAYYEKHGNFGNAAGDYIRTVLGGPKVGTVETASAVKKTAVQQYIDENNLQPVIDANKPNIWDDLIAKEFKYPASAEIPLPVKEDDFTFLGGAKATYNTHLSAKGTKQYDFASGMNTVAISTTEAHYTEANTGPYPGWEKAVTPTVNYLFNEDKYLADTKVHIDKTYSGHYSGQYQATSIIIDAGHGTGFNIGNIIKYAKRYGKKDGYNKADLMKIIHYAVMQMHVHDKENLS